MHRIIENISRLSILNIASLIILILLTSPLKAETRRALLVGIDKYEATSPSSTDSKTISEKETATTRISRGRIEWKNLDGAGNDVDAMYDILILNGFKPDNIIVIKDSQAKRDRILNELKNHLTNHPDLKPGDVSFFYYAGHGSQVTNKASNEQDQKDETIVPADSNEGAFDITDKELARIYNDALDKGIILTIISDSCHSGSIARGLPRSNKSRYLPPDPREIIDPSNPPKPEERGALILSAAQDDQLAFEDQDEHGESHGAFSLALIQTLAESLGTKSAEYIFLKTHSKLKARGFVQEPVIAGSDGRRKQTIFGDKPKDESGSAEFFVREIDKENNIVLSGGIASGLTKNSELIKLGDDKDKSSVKIRVTSVESLTLTKAKVIEGTHEEIMPGDVFKLTTWIAPAEARLKLWIPSSDLLYREIISISEEISKLRQANFELDLLILII